MTKDWSELHSDHLNSVMIYDHLNGLKSPIKGINFIDQHFLVAEFSKHHRYFFTNFAQSEVYQKPQFVF